MLLLHRLLICSYGLLATAAAAAAAAAVDSGETTTLPAAAAAFAPVQMASQNLRSSSRHLQGQGNGQGKKQPQALECTPVLLVGTRELDDDYDDDGHEEDQEMEEWVCESFSEDEISGASLMYELEGLNGNPKKYFEDNGIVSGMDTISISKATKTRAWEGTNGNANGHDKIKVEPGARVDINRGKGRGGNGNGHALGHNKRNLAQKNGTSTVLAVRVSSNDPTDPPVERTADEYASDLFGLGSADGTPEDDTFHMCSRVNACSGGKLQLKPAIDEGQGGIQGVVDVTIPYTITGMWRITVGNYAREATVDLLGPLEQWNHVMFTWTNAGNWTGAAAYAGVNGQFSYYRDKHFYKMGVNVHELGHNWGLLHSGENGKAYKDHTDLMGSPSWQDDMHKMCFNGAKSMELGWYSDNGGYQTVNVVDNGNEIGAQLLSLDNYLKGITTPSGSWVVVIKVVDPSQDDDFYLMYNRKVGENSEVREYGDEVTIVQGRPGKQSWLLYHLPIVSATSSSTTVPEFVGTGTGTLVVELCNTVPGEPIPDYVQLNVYMDYGVPADNPCCYDSDCDDGLYCNGQETCQSFSCVAGGDQCPGQACDEATDQCVACVVDGDCDDGDYCNGEETCQAGVCQAGTPVVCNDGVDCTDDSCNEATESCDFTSNCGSGQFCDESAGCLETCAETGDYCDYNSDCCSNRCHRRKKKCRN